MVNQSVRTAVSAIIMGYVHCAGRLSTTVLNYIKSVKMGLNVLYVKARGTGHMWVINKFYMMISSFDCVKNRGAFALMLTAHKG